MPEPCQRAPLPPRRKEKPTSTATQTPSQTPTATDTPSQTATATDTPSQTATATEAPSQTATATEAPSQTPTATDTPTSTATPTELPSQTPTPTGTPTPIPACVVRPEQTEGPFFLDVLLNRVDIRQDTNSGKIEEGVLLELLFNVSRINQSGCTTFENVQVDLWHTDALGNYSGVQGNSGNALRGYQLTNAAGVAQFLTIYPGWYPGRAVHIHFKLRVMVDDQGYDFTSQLYFDDNLTDQAYLSKPYSTRGERDTRNRDDGIYQSGGEQLLLTLTPTKQGYRATFEIALQV